MSTIVRKIISTTSAPKPGAPYSQAIQANDTLYISGCLGQDPITGELMTAGIKEQCKQAMNNIGAILKAAGTDFDHVVKMTVLLADINDFAAMNAVYKEYFKNNFPARLCYQVGALPKVSKAYCNGVEAMPIFRMGSSRSKPWPSLVKSSKLARRCDQHMIKSPT